MLYFEKYISGRPNTEWIVLIHGAGGNSNTWKHQVNAFKNDFNLIVLDLRGHGKSKLPEISKYSFDLICADVHEVLQTEGVEKAHFMGLSMGSIIIQYYAKKYPATIQSILLSGGVMGFNKILHLCLKAAVAINAIAPHSFTYWLFSYIVMPRKNHQYSRRVFIRAAQQLGANEFRKWFGLYNEFRITLESFLLEGFSIPILLVMGEQDHLFLKPAEIFYSKYSNCQLVVVPKTGHIVNIEKWGDFNSACLNFLKQLQLK